MELDVCQTLGQEAGRSLQLTLSARVVEGGGLALLACLTLLTNLLLWLVILIYRPLHSVVNIFLLSLSAAHFLEVTVSLMDSHTVILNRVLFSCAACKFMAFTASVLEFVSITSLCVLATNRYVRICQHASYQAVYTSTSVAVHILAQWTLAILWASMPFLGWGKYQYLPHLLLCSMDFDDLKSLRIAGRVAFTIMILVMICSYIAIFFRLSREENVSRMSSVVTTSSYGGHVRNGNVVSSIRNIPIVRTFRKLSAIAEVTDSDLTNDVLSKCRTNGGTLTLASSVSALESNTTGPGNSDRLLSPREMKPEKDNEDNNEDNIEEDFTPRPAHRRSLDVFSSDSSVDMADHKKYCYEKQFALSLFLVTVIYFLSFLPTFTLSKLNKSYYVSPEWKVTCLLVGHVDSMINPLLYGWGNSRIRTGYKQIFKQCMMWGRCKGSAQVKPG